MGAEIALGQKPVKGDGNQGLRKVETRTDTDTETGIRTGLTRMWTGSEIRIGG